MSSIFNKMRDVHRWVRSVERLATSGARLR
jgi:hypothetical protein